MNKLLLFLPPKIPQGWKELETPCPPEGNLYKSYAKNGITIIISIEGADHKHLHVSMRRECFQSVTNNEITQVLNEFFGPGIRPAETQEEFYSGKYWAEKQGVDFMPNVRHLIRLLK